MKHSEAIARRDLGAEAAEQRVLVRDDHAAGLASPMRAIALEVERLHRAQVEDLGVDALVGQLLRREVAALHQRAVGDQRDVAPGRTMRARPNGTVYSGPG